MPQQRNADIDALMQKHYIRSLSDNAEEIDKLYFQEMVLESLSDAEKEHYIRFLLEPRSRVGSEAKHNQNIQAMQPEKKHGGLLTKVKRLLHDWEHDGEGVIDPAMAPQHPAQQVDSSNAL